ncbi:hypothetical protein D3C86_1731350 [compost metagenome]
MSQPVIACRSVVALDVGILLRVARLNKVQSDTPFLGPSSEPCADKFGVVIASCSLRLSTPFNDLIQRTYHTFSRQRQINFHTQGFAVEVVNQIENPKAAPIR